MGKLSLHPGAWSSAVSLVGAGAVTVAPVGSFAWYSGWVLMALGVASFLWAVKIDDMHWWRAIFRRLPPTVYLKNTDAVDPGGRKTFTVLWKADELRLAFRGDGGGIWSNTPSIEKVLSVSLYNAGDDDIRHVEARWRLPGVGLESAIERSDLLGDTKKRMTGHELHLQNEKGAGAIIPVASDVIDPAIPVVRANETVTLKSALGFTMAYTLAALIRAKEHYRETVWTADVKTDALTVLADWHTKADDVIIEVSYNQAGRKRTQSFKLQATLYGGSQPFVPVVDDEGKFVATEGVIATLDNVCVVQND